MVLVVLALVVLLVLLLEFLLAEVVVVVVVAAAVARGYISTPPHYRTTAHTLTPPSDAHRVPLMLGPLTRLQPP